MATSHTKHKPTFLAQHWFLISLILVLPAGILGWSYLEWLNFYSWPRTLLVCLVMGLMALPIPIELIRQALARPWPALLASLINMVFIPLLAWAASLTQSSYLGGGLIVAAAIPCTLASAAVWTRRAGGDDTVAILVTLITNSTCVIVTPLWLMLMLRHSVQVDVGALVRELVVVVLIPILVAQLLRLQPRIAHWSHQYRTSLSLTCQLGILIMVLSGAIQMGQHMRGGQTHDTHAPSALAQQPIGAIEQQSLSKTEVSITVIEILWTVALTSGIHLVAMVVGWRLAGATGVARPQQVSVAIAGSQKTLMIGLKMALDCGVSILPMVAFHVGQLLLDTLIADRIRQRTTSAEVSNGK